MRAPIRRHARTASRRLSLTAAAVLVMAVVTMAGCGSGGEGPSVTTSPDGAGSGKPVILAETSYLADIAQNVAGDRAEVSSLLPLGSDPHSFEPTPQDAARIAAADALIVNSPGFEPPIDRLIAGAGSDGLLVIDASAGLEGAETDPHFWLDPSKVITYVDNIAAGLSSIDAAGKESYSSNAGAYQQRLKELDAWIAQRVSTIPPARRLLVTNHESFGRFAQRYGFTVVGTIIPSTGTEAAPSAEGLAELVSAIRATGAPAILLETGANPGLAEQIAREADVKVITDLYTHSLGDHAATYIDMMRWNVDRIVEALS